jgi:16S rRNA (guanine1516-N2)-methyltransferase
VRVDFVEGAAHRRLYGGGSGQMIAKAGIAQGVRPRVLDATAGLGKDAFVLASLGCEMSLIERQPLIGALLEDGLARAAEDFDVAPIVARMKLLKGNSIEVMRNWEGEPPQVIYLDPMFPHREKTALVKKEMRLFRPLVGDDPDAPALLEAALALATTGWWSSARARRRASKGRSRAMRWMANPVGMTSTRRKRSSLETESPIAASRSAFAAAQSILRADTPA